ncbi:hypothetical protein MHYP_G00176830 [Metynnis hypsauchen]
MSYTVTNLTAGVKYTFNVTAFAADNQTTGAAAQISAFTKPDVVTNLTVSNRSTSSVSLTWNLQQGINSFYTVQWTDVNGSNKVNVSYTTYTVTNLTAGGNYTFIVTAVAADGVTVGAPTQISTFTIPDVVKSLNVSGKNTSSVSLTWNSPQGNSSFFSVGWTDGNVSEQVNTSTMSYTVTNLTAGVKYTFNVAAFAADNQTTGAAAQISAFTKPDVVANLTVSNRSTSSVSLTWNLQQGINSFYTVQWTDVNGSNKVNVSYTTYTVTNLTPGGNYTFIVTAVAADGVTVGAPTQISTFTIPDVVSNLSVSDKNTSSVFLTWTLQHGYSSFYRVEWTGGSATPLPTSYMATNLTAGMNYTFSVTAVAADNKTTGATTQISTFTRQRSFFKVQWTRDNVMSNATTSQTFFNITNLIAGVNYYIIVSAVAADNSSEGNLVRISSYTKPDIVQNLTVTGVTTSSILLNWIKPVGESSYYRVQYDSLNMTLNQTSQNTTINISDLTPGVQYMFRVFAVAADNSTEGSYGYISTYTRYCYIRVSAVAADNKTEGEVVTCSPYTRPEIIRNLTAFQISTTNVSLNWAAPTGKSAFFRVLYQFNGSLIFNKTTKLTSFDITNLTPGNSYTFKVSAIADDNFTEGGIASLSTCTDASPVLTYSCEGPNRTDALLNIIWKQPFGSNLGFNLSSGTYISKTITCNLDCNHTISNLQYGIPYNVTITTVACGQSGTLNFVCKTGFTDPKVPTNPANLGITLSSDQKGTFVQFSDSLLNSTNGDITAYGVLLSTDFNSNTSRADLKYTYDDWKQKTSQTYLTVLKLNENRITRSEMIQIEIGTDEFANGTNYKNAPLVPNQYRVAVVVFTYLYISNGTVDTSLSFFSITPFAPDTINIYSKSCKSLLCSQSSLSQKQHCMKVIFI